MTVQKRNCIQPTGLQSSFLQRPGETTHSTSPQLAGVLRSSALRPGPLLLCTCPPLPSPETVGHSLSVFFPPSPSNGILQLQNFPMRRNQDFSEGESFSSLSVMANPHGRERAPRPHTPLWRALFTHQAQPLCPQPKLVEEPGPLPDSGTCAFSNPLCSR